MEDKQITHHQCWKLWRVWVDTETGSGHDAEILWKRMTFDEKCRHNDWYPDKDFENYRSAVDYYQNNMRLYVTYYNDWSNNGKRIYRTQGVVIWFVAWGTYDDQTLAYNDWQQAYCQFGWFDFEQEARENGYEI